MQFVQYYSANENNLKKKKKNFPKMYKKQNEELPILCYICKCIKCQEDFGCPEVGIKDYCELPFRAWI